MINFSGNHEEIGRQIGEYYKKKGTKTKKVVVDRKLFLEQTKIYKKYFPERLIQLEAIAKAADFDQDEYIYGNICTFIDWHKDWIEPKKGCTIFGVGNKAGVYVGRNYDWVPGDEREFEVMMSKNSDAYDYIGITDMDFFSVADLKSHHLFFDIDDAINEHGLYIGLTFAYCDNYTYGLSPVDIIQLITETCKTVSEAIDLFNKVPLAVPKNYFIADRDGNLAVVEHAATKHKVLHPQNSILVQTNHYLDSELSEIDTVLNHSPHNSTFKRYAHALEQLTTNKDKIHQIGIHRILDLPERGVYEDAKRFRTIWSLALDVRQRSYRLYWLIDGKVQETKLSFD